MTEQTATLSTDEMVAISDTQALTDAQYGTAVRLIVDYRARGISDAQAAKAMADAANSGTPGVRAVSKTTLSRYGESAASIIATGATLDTASDADFATIVRAIIRVKVLTKWRAGVDQLMRDLPADTPAPARYSALVDMATGLNAAAAMNTGGRPKGTPNGGKSDDADNSGGGKSGATDAVADAKTDEEKLAAHLRAAVALLRRGTRADKDVRNVFAELLAEMPKAERRTPVK